MSNGVWHNCDCPLCPVKSAAPPPRPEPEAPVPRHLTLTWNLPRGCGACRGPIWIVGPWTCSACGTRYEAASYSTVSTNALINYEVTSATHAIDTVWSGK